MARISPLSPGSTWPARSWPVDRPVPHRPATGHRPRLRPRRGPPRRVRRGGPGPGPTGWSRSPQASTTRQAAVIGTAGFTAALSLHRLGAPGLTPADGPVLVTGASGGVGSMAVALLACRRLHGRGQHRQDRGERLPARAGGHRGDRPRRSGESPRSAPSDRSGGPVRWTASEEPPSPPCSAPSATEAAVAASGLTGGDHLESSVYPFIVRAASLIGVDTVLTPIAERRAVWEELATAYPAGAPRGAWSTAELGLDELGPALELILAGGVRGRVLVPTRSTARRRRRSDCWPRWSKRPATRSGSRRRTGPRWPPPTDGR